MNYLGSIENYNLALLLRILFFVIFLSPFLLNKLINFSLKISILFALLIFFFPYLSKSDNPEISLITQSAIGALLGLTIGSIIISFELIALWVSRNISESFEAEYLTIKSRNSFQVLYLAVFLFLFSFFTNCLNLVFQFFIEGFSQIPLEFDFNENFQETAITIITALFKLSFSVATIFCLPLFVSILALVLCSAFVKKYFSAFAEKAVFSATLIQLVLLLLCYIILNSETVLDQLIKENINGNQFLELRKLL